MSSQPPAPPDDPGEEPTYEVGYGKPPQATRFQPGKSGNPKGRPKGSRKAPPVDVAVEKLKALVLEEAYRPIKIKDGDDAGGAADDPGGAAQRHPQRGEGQPAGAAHALRLRGRGRGRATPRPPEALRGGGSLQAAGRGADRLGAPARLAGARAGAAPRPSHHRPDRRVGETARSVYARRKGGMGPAHRHESRPPEAAHRSGGGAAGRAAQPQPEGRGSRPFAR